MERPPSPLPLAPPPRSDDAAPPSNPNPNPNRPWAPTRKRSASGAAGLLSKIPFMRSSAEHLRPRSRRSADGNESAVSVQQQQQQPTFPPTPSFRTIPADARSHAHAYAHVGNGTAAAEPPPVALAVLQQQKTRRRRGSLRKVALLGRGAQRERREGRALAIDTRYHQLDGTLAVGQEEIATGPGVVVSSLNPFTAFDKNGFPVGFDDGDGALGLGISDITPRPSMDGYASRSAAAAALNQGTTPAALSVPTVVANTLPDIAAATDSSVTSSSVSYSTTDDEDGLHMSRTGSNGGGGPGSSSRPSTNPSLSLSSSPSTSILRPERASLSSGSEGYFPTLQHTHTHAHPRPLGLSSGSTGGGGSVALTSMQRRRNTIQRAKSPLALTSLAGLSTTPLPPPDADWDYSETEWWGWVVLVVTWTVFVTGMGSCLGVWTWAWDVGTTPYAPPELENDPTLPIVGYYPALLILTGVMAWVWVVVAWVGMKYFRHARVNGD
ncbi:hypothetical protein B0T26DRAFT_696598 [Lasiosphaeria miniovina]|uniref:Uncharacterized protein n=1 Tax=Lasiosphaeria miniovina TaxID=1954250 RepID=A0AA40B5F7_9PEZI|nr:uncharacterized protein B0T26DRAFT_696598 [Lasiosphaeria miniovina]KAK0728036.1 hypothetical protein B0T26DRAFT_696598 [Lasiosphaeria miniovina]